MTTDQMTPLVDIFTHICAHISAMIDMEQQKRESLLHHDIEQTNKLMQNQQAMMMQLEIMEKKRISAQKNAGFSSMTGQDMLDAVSKEEQSLLAPLLNQMRFLAQELQALNKVSLGIATTELRLMGQSPVASSGGLYQSNGKKRNSPFNGGSFQEIF